MSSPNYQVDTTIDYSESIVKSYKQTEAADQRENLKKMVLSKYLNLYGQKSKQLAEIIRKEVDYYFYREKVNESGIRILKMRLEKIANDPSLCYAPFPFSKKKNTFTLLPSHTESNYKNSPQSSERLPLISIESTLSKKSRKNRNLTQTDIPYFTIENNKSLHEIHSKERKEIFGFQSDILSQSSRKKSIYCLEGEKQDEWAALIQLDTNIYQMERENQKLKIEKAKQQLKQELEKQLNYKQEQIMKEKQERLLFLQKQQEAAQEMQNLEKRKFDEKQLKIQQEKVMREQQALDLKMKRKQERAQDRELDFAMIKKLEEKRQEEESNKQQKKEKEKLRTIQVIIENQKNKEKMESQMIQEKETDIIMQKNYEKILDEQEERREKEKMIRFQKISEITKKFENAVQKGQKELAKQEDEKMLKNIQENDLKQNEIAAKKKKAKEEQKDIVNKYIEIQLQEKRKQKIEQDHLDKQHALQIAQDREEFIKTEALKGGKAAMARKHLQESILSQIRDKESYNSVNKGKMSIHELLQNKNLIQKMITLSPNQINYKKYNQTDINRLI